MSERKDTVLDIARAIGFVAAVVVGGIFIAVVVDGYNAAQEDAAGEEGSEADAERSAAD